MFRAVAMPGIVGCVASRCDLQTRAHGPKESAVGGAQNTSGIGVPRFHVFGDLTCVSMVSLQLVSHRTTSRLTVDEVPQRPLGEPIREGRHRLQCRCTHRIAVDDRVPDSPETSGDEATLTIR